MFDGCSNLISLDLSNFNTSSVTIISNRFTFSRCYNLANINLINAKLTKNIIYNSNKISKYSGLPSNLFICTENEDWPKIFNLSDKQYVNCINNIFYSNINENESIIKCYKNKIESDNPCQMCGNNYLNNSGIINNTYMNCFINVTSDYSSFDSSIIIEKEIEIKNRTELIQNMINNLFQRINISYIDKGEDEKTDDKNISIIITSTKNQKKNENESIITIDLCKCENILKSEYNISLNDSLYILQIIYQEEGMKIPKIDYEIYYPFCDNNLTKLNLNFCIGTKIEISLPVTLNDI